MVDEDFREKINDSSGSSVSTVSLQEFDELTGILNQKSHETSDEFQKMADSFGQTLTMTGFQRAVLRDKIDELEAQIDEEDYRIEETAEKLENFEMSIDTTLVLMEKCREGLADVRGVYLKKLMDEDLMKSNLCRVEEMKATLEAMRRASEPEPPNTELPDFDKILEDVSTGRSFCLDDT